MKDRLIQLLDLEKMTPSKFADLIGVQRSSVSHVLSGRNNPSFDFLQKTLKAFPGLRADWLIQGEGTMYAQMGQDRPVGLFETQVATPDADATGSLTDTVESAADNDPEPPEEEVIRNNAVRTRKVVQVIVVYDDDTFNSYDPPV